MLKDFDESELLALIEGELDVARASALRARLANNARAQALVDRMTSDRAALRGLSEPELPMDFLAQSEQVLARPMLIEPVEHVAPRPGQYRRQQQRLRWRVRWPRLAAAAALLLALGAGAWWGAATMWPHGASRDSLALNDERAAQPSVPLPIVSVGGAIEEIEGTIHHALPLSLPPQALAMLHGQSNRPEAGAVLKQEGDRKFVDAEVVLVVSGADVAELESVLSDRMTECSSATALVRNFSIDEARRLESQWRLANGGLPTADGQPALADVRAGMNGPDRSMSELAAHVRQQLASQPRLHRGTGAEASAENTSGTVAGDDEFAPALEQQLELSSRGATHTVVIQVRWLEALVQELGAPGSQSTTLRLLPAADAEDSSKKLALEPDRALRTWLNEGRQVRKAMQRLIAGDPDAWVRLPVVVEVDSTRVGD